MDGEQPLIQQESITLYPFESNVPVLHTPDGDYLPIRPLCDLLGLAPAVWTGVLCRRFKPVGGVHKWPYTPPDGNTVETWCLQIDELSLWMMRLNPRYVQGKRREQLEAFQQTMMDAAARIYLQDQWASQAQYQQARERLFTQANDCNSGYAALASIEAWMQIHMPHMRGYLPDADAALEDVLALLADGRARYDASRASLQSAIQKMQKRAAIDTVILDADGLLTDTIAMPILPSIPDTSDVDACFEHIQAWWVTFRAWIMARGLADDTPGSNTR